MGDGHIELKGTVTDWRSHFLFPDRQLLPDGNDTDECWDFSNNKNLDAMMDALWPSLPVSVQQQISAWGFMDVSPVDNMPHFHSSELFIGSLSGALQNGGTSPEFWDGFRKWGCVPYTLLPDTQTLQQWDDAVIPQSVKDIGIQFLNLMGGKNFAQYHWIVNGGANNIPAMVRALPTAPLSLGIPVDDAGWNQVTPTVATGAPVHDVAAYAVAGGTVDIVDNYSPNFKELAPGYQMSYVFQAVLNYITPQSPETPPNPPVLPPPPTTLAQDQNFITQAILWVQAILKQMQKGVKGATIIPKVVETKKTMTKFQQALVSFGIRIVVVGAVAAINYAVSSLSSGAVQLPDGTVTVPILGLLLSEADTWLVNWEKNNIPTTQ